MEQPKLVKPKYFETPEALLQTWEDYKATLTKEAEKWGKVQYVGKDGNRVVDFPKLPLTLEGFSVFCFKTVGNVKQYFVNADKRYDAYITICNHIKEEIRQDQITGGLLGMYNPSITQRLNNLVERTDVTTDDEKITTLKVEMVSGVNKLPNKESDVDLEL